MNGSVVEVTTAAVDDDDDDDGSTDATVGGESSVTTKKIEDVRTMKRSMSQDNEDILDILGENDKRKRQKTTIDSDASTNPKQSPTGKVAKYTLAADNRMYFSYADIHKTIMSLAERVKAFRPQVMIAIGGGGFIPARILRTKVRVPILAVSLELYEDATCAARSAVKKVQWFDETSGVGKLVRGKRVLIVDEVDDTRTTLQYCCEELISGHAPAKVAVCVVHNKIKRKKGVLPDGVVYMAGEDVADQWNCVRTKICYTKYRLLTSILVFASRSYPSAPSRKSIYPPHSLSFPSL